MKRIYILTLCVLISGNIFQAYTQDSTPEYNRFITPKQLDNNPSNFPKSKSTILLHYDEENYSAIGLTSGGTFIGLAYFPEDMVEPYIGMGISKVHTFIHDLPSGNYELRIYESQNSPDNLIYSQDVTSLLEPNSWNVFELDEPYEIKSESVYVGFMVTTIAGEYTPGTDEGPAHTHGGMVSLDNGISWENLASFGFGNWNVRAEVEPLIFEDAPNQATNFSVTPGNEGLMSAQVSWLNPTITVSEETLTEISHVELHVNGEVVFSNDSPSIGGEESTTVDLALEQPGLFEFSVIANNSAGSGIPLTKFQWIGEDIPSAPSNLQLTEDDGKPVLIWDEPMQGQHQGYFTGVDSYKIVRSDGKVLEENYSGAQPYKDESHNVLGTFTYSVYAINSIGRGPAAISNPKLIGHIVELVKVGEGETYSGNRIPFDFFFKNGLSQVIYYPEELNITGRIEAIGYENQFINDFKQGTPVKIWIGETHKENLEDGFIPATDLTLVYNSTLCIPSGENHIVIPFELPYFYKGGNLVILANRPMGNVLNTSYMDNWKQSPADNFRAIFRNSDDIVLDAANPPSNPNQAGTFANTTFYFDERPTIIPNKRDYIVEDENDLTTTVYWINATSLEVKNNEDILVLDADYTLSSETNGTSKLTILGTYLSDQIFNVDDNPLDLTVTFDTSDEVVFTAIPSLKMIIEVKALDPIKLGMGVEFNDLPLPQTVEVLLNNGLTTHLDITWEESGYNPELPKKYIIKGNLSLGTIVNPDNLRAEIEVEVFYHVNNIIEDFEDLITLPDNWRANYFISPYGGVDNSARLTRNLWQNAQTGFWQTPVINMGQTPLFNFMYRVVDYAAYPSLPTNAEDIYIRILVSNDFGETFSEIYVIDENNHNSSTAYVEKSISFDQFAGEYLIIRVESQWLSGDYYTDFDNLYIGSFSNVKFSVMNSETNDPITEAAVNLNLDNQSKATWTGYTNNNGEVTFFVLGEESYEYEVSKYGYTNKQGNFDVSAEDITVNVLLESMQSYTITGAVVTNDTPPENISGANVILHGYGNYSTLTDENGNFTISDVYHGTYTLSIRYYGYETLHKEFLVDKETSLGTLELIEIIDDPYNLQIEVNTEELSALFTWNNPDPWHESFEDGDIPEGWSQIITNTGSSGVGDHTWQVTGTVTFSESQIVPQDGDYQAFIMWDYAHQDEWLITPEFIAPPADLTFWYYGSNGSTNGDNYYVKITEDEGNTWEILWNASDLPSGQNQYDVPAVIDLSEYAGRTVQIAWQNVDGDGQGLWYAWALDNITVGGTKIDIKDLTYKSIAVNTEGRKNEAARDGIFRESVKIEDLVPARINAKALNGFNIFLNNMDTPIDFVEDNTSYVFKDITTGSHIAGVQAVYSTGESSIITIDFDFLTSAETYGVDPIVVYPNPFSRYVNIKGVHNYERLIVTNLIGKKVLDIQLKGDTKLDLQNLPNGVYLFILRAKNGEKTIVKMIK